MAFNPNEFLYYNPELQAYSNVITIENAQSFYNSGNATSLIYNTSVLPQQLDPLVFLSTNKDFLPISWMSRVIRHAMSNEGLSESEIDTKARYTTTILSSVIPTSSNVFALANYPSYRFDSNNLSVGDDIRIVDNEKAEYLLRVTGVTPSNFITTDNKYTYLSNNTFVLEGIKVTDPLRMSKVFLVRDFATTFSNQQYALPSSGSFNPSLYKMLYPDASTLNDQDAYVDYISKRKYNDYRINNASEIVANIVSSDSNLKVIGVNKEVVFGESNKLITEHGVKKYTDDSFSAFQSNATFVNASVSDTLSACNVRVSNSMILTGTSTFSNAIYAQGTATFSSNVNINNALVYGTLRIRGNMYNAHIGIGYWESNDAYDTPTSNQDVHIVDLGSSNILIDGSNVGFGTSNPGEKVDIVGNARISDSLYVMGNIGIGMSNPQYKLELSSDSAAKPSSATWTVSSDSNLKDGVVEADYYRCYEIVKQLPLKRYAWKPEYLSNATVTDTSKLGWIAQDVQGVFPKAVGKRNIPNMGEYLTLDNDQIYASMYGSIKTLQFMVEELQRDNKEMKEMLLLNKKTIDTSN